MMNTAARIVMIHMISTGNRILFILTLSFLATPVEQKWLGPQDVAEFTFRASGLESSFCFGESG